MNKILRAEALRMTAVVVILSEAKNLKGGRIYGTFFMVSGYGNDSPAE